MTHIVKVVEADPEFPTLDFTRTDPKGDCHKYPEEEGSWTKEYAHANGTWHEDCWMKDWFGIPEALSYAGSLAALEVGQEGEITANCIDGDYLEWRFANEPIASGGS